MLELSLTQMREATDRQSHLRQGLKTVLARAARRCPQARYDRCILILSHMRAATTVLSNVLTAHPDISGFGETQVSHNDAFGPARMLVSLLAKGAYRPKAPYILDKILHSAHHATPSEAFFNARAIFLLRPPEATVASIARLAQRTDMARYRDQGAAADYYLDRVEMMSRAWDRFPRSHRIGILTSALWDDPDGAVADLGQLLPLGTPLQNRFQRHPASRTSGRGDPFADDRVMRIEQRIERRTDIPAPPLDQHSACTAAYEMLKAKFAEPP